MRGAEPLWGRGASCFGDAVAVGRGCTGGDRLGPVLLQTRHTHLQASLILGGPHKHPCSEPNTTVSVSSDLEEAREGAGGC